MVLKLGAAAMLTASLLAGSLGGDVGAAKRYRVVLVAEPIGVGDTYWAIAVAGFRRAARDFGLEARVVTQPNRTSFASTYGALARQGYDLAGLVELRRPGRMWSPPWAESSSRPSTATSPASAPALTVRARDPGT